MNINATLAGQFIVVLAIVMAIICFYLGKRKTQNPALASLIGFFSALIPLIALVYLIVLVLRKDITPNNDVADSSSI
jgi:zinc transporter ZupT